MRVRPKDGDLVIARLSYYGSPMNAESLKRWRAGDDHRPLDQIHDWDEREKITKGRIGITKMGYLHAHARMYPGRHSVIWQDRTPQIRHYMNQSVTILPRPTE
jgi:hypothetical protein